MKDRKLPTADRPCPKCGDVTAHGPEYRRGIKGDEDLGEHLRYYCATCGYMTLEPTQDQDTPERRVELVAAFAARMNRPRPTYQDRNVPGDLNRYDRDRDNPFPSRRPSQGWSK